MPRSLSPYVCASTVLLGLSLFTSCQRQPRGASDANRPAYPSASYANSLASPATATVSTPQNAQSAANIPASGTDPATTQAATGSFPALTGSMPAVSEVTIPATTRLRVRINESLDTKRNRTNDGFSAVLESPVVIGDRVALPQGTGFHGHILVSRSSGRLKGRAELSLVLDEVELAGTNYPIDTRSNARVSRGHKRRNWGWIGGGSGVGATMGP